MAAGAGDIGAIMSEGSAAPKSSGKGEKAGPVYDIWYLLKVFLVLFLIVAVFSYFMDKRKERAIEIEEGEEEEEKKPKRKRKKL
jgi:flagellar basal body-associated protein FliL